jgi:glycerophosphoryl diester phosphodiesterase
MNLYESAKERIIIAAHRGTSGGNIPCNTIVAYDAALAHGADMLEVDANISADGTLYSFHPEMEKIHLNRDCHLPEMHDDEIRKLRYVNYDRVETELGICTLDEVFERYKNRCYINIDKFWVHPKKIADLIRRHDMADQIVVKTEPVPELFDIIEEYAPDIAYLPIIREDRGIHEMLKSRNINYVGVEVLFETDDHYLCSDEYIAKIHADKKLVWANSIIYNYKEQIAARHSDDTAIAGNEDGSWGWLADKGFDIIQTDWTLAMKLYLERTGKRYRR